jgi:hypothetical protein
MNSNRFTRIGSFLFIVVALSPGVDAQSYDVAWTFGNVGSSSYRLDAFEPTSSELGMIGSPNPTLPLELGQRYQVKVTDYNVHPLEIIAKAASPSQDRVLLSMAIKGPLESDSDINWEDDGRGTARFTLTLSLYEAMNAEGRKPGYRCRPHLFTMRGDFTVSCLPIAERIGPSPIRIDLETIAA